MDTLSLIAIYSMIVVIGGAVECFWLQFKTAGDTI